MRTQVWKGRLVLLWVCLLWFTTYPISAVGEPAYAPLVVDGSANDWGGPLKLGLGDHRFDDVLPTYVPAIDIFRLSHTFGENVDMAGDSFYMIFMFQGQALGDSVEAHYELYFDVDPVEVTEGIPKGQSQEIWKDFHPDYRFRITGRDGRIESELYQLWDGDKWVGEPQTDVSQIEAAVEGQFFECRIPWSSLGNFMEEAADHPDEGAPLKWGLHASEAQSHDWYPDPGYFRPNGGLSAATSVGIPPWGEIKSLYK